MRAARRCWKRLLGSFTAGRRERELAEEFAAHVEMQTEENVRSGMPPAEARRAALLKFGGMESAKEGWRDQRGLPWLETAAKDVHFALRGFARRPGFALAAAASLALGIGLNATVFTWLKAFWLDPLPGVREARRLVTVNAAFQNREGMSNAYPDLLYIREHAGVFQGVFGHEWKGAAMSDGRTAEMTPGGVVTVNCFEVLGTRMALGRGFRADEERRPVMVISHNLWQRRFGSDPGILGRHLELNRTAFTVIGVAEPGFAGVYGGIGQDYWAPEQGDPARRGWQIMGRPRPGVSLAAIQARLDVLAPRMRADYRRNTPDYRPVAYALHDAQRGYHAELFSTAQVLAVAVGIVLLLACLNVANLSVARGTDRAREISIRLSLGAGRGRVLRQLLTESALLALIGGAGGLVMACWSRSLPRLLTPGDFTLVLNTGIDWRVLVFLAAVTSLATLASGLLPAFTATRVELAETLKAGSGSVVAGGGRSFWRGLLVAGQVALSLAALAGAGLFARHFRTMLQADPGFRSAGLLTARTDLQAAGIEEQRRGIYYRTILDELKTSAAVESAAWTSFVPMSGYGGGNTSALEVPGFESRGLFVVVDAITPGFLHTLGIPLLRGRDFTWADHERSAPAAMVNETFAQKYFAGRDAVGAKIRIADQWRTIVGVHRNYAYRHPQRPVEPAVFLPMDQNLRSQACVMVRTKAPFTASDLRRVFDGVDRRVALTAISTMQEIIDTRYADMRAITTALSLFGLIACTLAAVGIYGLLAAYVRRRRREFGIRAALGAKPTDLRLLVLRQGLRLALAGALLGLPLAWVFTQVLRNLLPNLPPPHAGVFVAAAVGVAVTTLISTWLPARAAVRMDPNEALRTE